MMKYLTIIGLLLAVTAHNTAASSQEYLKHRSAFFNQMANKREFSAFVASDFEGNILKMSSNFSPTPTSCDLKIIATEALGKRSCPSKDVVSLGGRTYKCREIPNNDTPIEHIVYEQLDNRGRIMRKGNTFLCSKITDAVMCAIYTTNDRTKWNVAMEALVKGGGYQLKMMYEW